ncbi:hypothetical protein O6H91_12G060900 [Diphasiastrum complanatum]|uniref:Uncharacterized protein n=1 Tax=Diphasiastrum complanatum TaxID=34168 RepID=A0ACC2C2K7_DIPCM|nr:hypothetical protein O6H91_12G060900 [Diphasiastrum complanatum]
MICTKTGVQFLYGESYAPETKWPSTAETDQNHMHLKRTGRLRFHLMKRSGISTNTLYATSVVHLFAYATVGTTSQLIKIGRLG